MDGGGTRILIGSQRIKVQTCLTYSSSIQGSKLPHQTEEREIEGGDVGTGGVVEGKVPKGDAAKRRLDWIQSSLF